MSFGTEVIAFIQTELGLGTYTPNAAGGTIYLDSMPATPDVLISVYVTGGAPPETGFGVPGIQYEFPTCAIRVRGAANDRQGPHARAILIYNALPTIQGRTLSGTKYQTLKPMQPPFIYEMDSEKRFVWTFNAIADKEPSA